MTVQASRRFIKPPDAHAAKRFELPALDFERGSLTDGTNIPPPLPSPVSIPEEPPANTLESLTPVAQEQDNTTAKKDHVQVTEAHIRVPPTSTSIFRVTSRSGKKRCVEEITSPLVYPHRSVSLRRIFNRSLFSHTYGNEEKTHTSFDCARPPSRSSFMDITGARKPIAWLGKLRNNHPVSNADDDNPRISVSPQLKSKSSIPPHSLPPVIPEITTLKLPLDLDGKASLVT